MIPIYKYNCNYGAFIYIYEMILKAINCDLVAKFAIGISYNLNYESSLATLTRLTGKLVKIPAIITFLCVSNNWCEYNNVKCVFTFNCEI